MDVFNGMGIPSPSDSMFATLMASTLFLVLFLAKSDRFTLLRRRLSIRPYQAPWDHDPDDPDEVPGEYHVILHLGCSLEDHKKLVGRQGVDLDTRFTYVAPKRDWHGPIYAARLDDSALAIVRADCAVDKIQCERTLRMNMGDSSDSEDSCEEDSTLAQRQALPEPYSAPLDPAAGRNIVPGEFQVILHHRCSLDEHKNVLSQQGVDLDSRLTRAAPTEHHRVVIYTAQLDDSALAVVRADCAVDMVNRLRYAAGEEPGCGPDEADDTITRREPLPEPYEAPLDVDDGRNIVPGEYHVILHLGCSIDEHKKLVAQQGVDLDSRFTYIAPTAHDRRAIYVARLDETALAIVRADCAVDQVNRERYCFLHCGEVTDGESEEAGDTPSQQQAPQEQPYQAPLKTYSEENKVPGVYWVFINTSSSLEEHKTTMSRQGLDLEPRISFTSSPNERFGGVYVASLDDAALAIVRADRAVDEVYCEAHGRFPKGEETEEVDADGNLLHGPPPQA